MSRYNHEPLSSYYHITHHHCRIIRHWRCLLVIGSIGCERAAPECLLAGDFRRGEGTRGLTDRATNGYADRDASRYGHADSRTDRDTNHNPNGDSNRYTKAHENTQTDQDTQTN